jgi:hypothetical protein
VTGVSAHALDEAAARLGVSLPNDYRDFMQEENGFEGWFGEAFVQVYSLETMLAVNAVVAESEPNPAPGLVFFGSDGSREGLAWDYRGRQPRVVMVDISSGWDEAIVQAPTFSAFMRQVEETGNFVWE